MENRSGSASHAPSEVEVFCAEKDPGFFATLRMTQKKARASGAGSSSRLCKGLEMASDHFGKAKGYEYYEMMAKNLKGNTDASVEYFLNLQVWGTPEMCFNRIDEIRRKVGADHFTGVFSYAGMPIEDAEKSLRLFASEVMPEVKKLNGANAEAA